MTRSRAALICAVGFLALFFLSSVHASLTLGDNTVTDYLQMGAVLFTLSSRNVLMLPLTLALMLIAMVGLLKKQRSVGMLFAGLATAVFTAFLFFYAREGINESLFQRLSALMTGELGVRVRRRDVDFIYVTYSFHVFLVLAAGVLTTLLAAPPMKSKLERNLVRRSLLPYAYIGPHLFFFIIFFVTPAVYGIYAAFTRWNLFNDPVWVGFDNFRTILFDEGNTFHRQLRNGLSNTIRFVALAVPFCIIVPLTLALALQTRPMGRKFFQALYYLPALMSISTVMIAWQYMFFRAFGAMNHFFMTTPDWLTPPHSWASLVIVTVWWVTGATMVIYQSSLASIPKELYEAASVDGGNVWQKFIHITIPGMKYPLSFTIMAALVAQFNVYGQPLFLVGFGNQEANAVLLMYIIENAVNNQIAGIASAMALILGLCILVVSVIQLKIMRANVPH